MAMGTQPTFDVSSMPNHLALDPAFHDVIPLRPQSFESSEPIQIQIQIRLSVSAVPTIYPESAYQWLVEVLDGLIDFGRRHGHYGVIKLTEDEYQWLDDVLEELIYSVGENENHPLAPLMEFIIQIIDNYEDAYVPKLTELFPELAEEAPIETASKIKQPISNIPQQSESELAAQAFFSIGYLLYQGNRKEKVLDAYEKAIALKPDCWEAFYNLGIVRCDLKQYPEAMTDLNKTIELNPKFASAYHNRGTLKFKLKDHEGAVDDFNRVINLNPNNAGAYYNKGYANYQIGKPSSCNWRL